ncbi:MAG: AEC family transporter [Candidatus Binataceae bacterium]|jgi:predicted permease
MLNVFFALAVIAGVGASLHRLIPDLDIDSTRRQCGRLVLNVLLPALNIEVLYKSTASSNLWQVPLAMLLGILICLATAMLVFRFFALDRKLKSALLLGCAFGNVTYLGMPLLQGLFPDQLLQVTEIAILCEISVTSADLITGSLLATFYIEGERSSLAAALRQVLMFPLLWSAAVALTLRALSIPLPAFLLMALHILGQSTSGLMLLILGMALKPDVLKGALARLKSWWPLLLIKLVLSPIVVGFVGALIGLSGLNLHAVTLEAAMPPQLFALIVADRFGFDTETLAGAAAFMIVLSLATTAVVHRLMP